MTAVTFVGANAGVSGNNTPLAPTIHASAAAGDLMLLFASIRNTAGVVVAPAGWTPVISATHVALLAKTHSGAESAPTVTFTGGAAGDDTLAQVAVFRTAMAFITGVSHVEVNTATQNIDLLAAATPNRDGSLVLALGWKQDDWTSVATLAGTTEIGETISIAGNDAAQVWDYRIDTTSAAAPTGPFVVTGGLAAISKGITVSLAQRVFITVTPQDLYPPRVLVSATNLVIGDNVEIYRVVAGARTLVRAGSDPSVTDPSFLRVDAELPFGVPVSYVVSINGLETSTPPVTYTLPGGKVALSDAVGGQAAEVVVLAWPEKTYGRDSSTFRAGGRNIARLGDLVGASSTMELHVETTSAVEGVLALLHGATEGIVQVRQTGGYDRVDGYLAVLSAVERRFSQDGSDQRRTIALDVLEVEAWAPALEAAGYTLQDLADTYTGQTLADIAGDFATLLDIAQAELL
jgi:hypothetical protein